jgi:predicted RecB family nuclease
MRSYLASALFSASDLVNFTGCLHCTFLDLRDLLNDEKLKGTSDSQAELLQQKGVEHEQAFLSSLMDSGFRIAEVPTNLTLEERVILTRQAMSEGSDVIYQGALLGPPWHGYSDFLRRVETPSLLGAYSYEVIDTKLSRHARPKHVFQLCVYSDLLAKEQGLIPPRMHIVLGDNRQESFRTADFVHFYRLLRQRFQTFAASPPGTSEPEPCGHCEFCRWNAQCQSQWASTEHLCLTAGITRNQSARLRTADIGTMRALAQQNGQRLRGFLPATFTRLTSQAALQLRKRDLGGDWVEILPLRTAVGFNRLPKPDPGDLFFDMEGDPLYEGNLEYLFGFVRMKDDVEQFVPFWAHDRVQEKLAFAAAVDFIKDQLARHPNAHIYHYNHYEMTALKRLASFNRENSQVLGVLHRVFAASVSSNQKACSVFGT